MKEFITAAKRDLEEGESDGAVEFDHDGTIVKFFRPSSTQLAIMATMKSSAKPSPEQLGTFMQLFLGLMEEETLAYFKSRLLDVNDSISEFDAEGGVQDIFEYLIEEWSAKNTKQPSDFQPPRRATGRKSTANTPEKGSTSRSSRSTASSR